MMVSPRRLSLVTGTAIVAVALMCVMIASKRTVSNDAREQARRATARLDSLGDSPGDSTRALALAYVELARLGMGSPFRLVDQAVHDPRLDPATRDIVAWSVLDRLFSRGTYEIDASVLDAVGPNAAGAGHLALIDRVISSATDPRVGETTLRLAYGLASANGTLSSGALPIVTEVSALIRDRALAERDLRRAIPRADAHGVGLIDELIHQRATRELDVERPLLGALTADDQNDAIAAVPNVLKQIAAIQPESLFVFSGSRSVLDSRAAVMLSRFGARLPPVAATSVTLQTRAALLLSDSMLSPAMTRFLLSATNEETMTATFAYASRETRGRSVGAARVIVSAAVALRALAQERVWFAGDAVPGASDVSRRFGLRAITFDADVPRVWRPYYVRMIASALDDMRRVMPSFEPTDLTIRIGMSSLADSALAVHDPRTHTLLLSAATAAGTITHELAHDLDWQSARRLFAKGGGYATDRALRENGGPLATSVRGLAAARVVGRTRPSTATGSRPAEVFARGTDWFVTDALAHLGRSNGYMSAIEDQLIGGYAASAGDAASLSGAPALIKGLAEMTVIPDSIASGYLGRWESLDRLDPAAVMVRLLDAPVVMRRPPRAPFGVSSATAAALAAPSVCLLDKLKFGSPRDQLLVATIEARARGIVLWRARMTPLTQRPAWAHAAAGNPVWNPRAVDDVLRRTTASVLEGAGRAGFVAIPPAPFRPAC